MRFDRSRVLLFAFFATLVMLVAAACGRSDPDDFLYSAVGGSGGASATGAGANGPGTTASTSTNVGGAGGATVGTGGAGGSGGIVQLLSIAITPPTSTITVGTSVQLTATGTYSDNSTQDLTALATWSGPTPPVTVSAGQVTGIAPGDAKISAGLDGVFGGAAVFVSKATIVSIAVTPPTATTDPGGTVTFAAIATLSDNSTQDVTASATWASSSPAIATVANGLATGQAAGTTAITASVGAITGKAALTVNGATLVSIAVTPTNPTIGLNIFLPFTATGTYSDNSIADLTKTAMWGSSDAGVLAVDPIGNGTSLTPGTSIVTASFGGVTGTTTVTVTSATLVSITVTPPATTLAIAATQQLTATGTYSDMTTGDLTLSVTWSSSSAGVASVSNAAGSKGLATAIGAGSATITATLGAVSGTATINVTAATLVSISITPANPSLPKATLLPFIAKGTYSDMSVVDITTSVAWSTDNAAVATISNAPGTNGVATTIAIGTTGVHALLDGITGSTTLTVTNAALVSITVTPANPGLSSGQKLAMTAIATYSDMSTVNVTATAVWTSANAAVATVANAPAGAQGLLTAVGPGSTKVTATLAGVSGSTLVTVTMPAIQQIIVSPINPSRPIGQKQQFTATVIFTNQTQMNVTGQAAWKSSNPAVATMGNGPQQSVATAISAGTSTITASYMGFTGTTTFTVANAVVTSISVTPIDPTYSAGTIQQFQAVAIFSDNTSQNVTAQATWSSSKPAVAGVGTMGGQRGRVTTVATGTTTISATYMGITGTSTVTVSAAVIVSISVSPPASNVAVGTTLQLTAQAIYSDNTSKPITGQATWSSSNAGVAAVSDQGLTKGQAKSIAAGTATISASYQGVTGTATITVSGATLVSIELSPSQPTVSKGVPVAFTCTGIFSDNTSQPCTGQATWTSNDPAVAAVSDAAGTKGETQTIAAGTATISATWDGVTGSTLITVTAATLVTIQVTPFAPSLPVGFVTDFQATGIYSDNSTLDITTLATWISSTPGTASVTDANPNKGRVSPLAPGGATITASYQGVTGSDSVTVSSATLVSIAVTPPLATIAVGATEPFVATGTFSDNSTLDVTVYVTWFSSAAATASISNANGSKGQAKGLASGGPVMITAVRGAITGGASLTVQ